MKFRMARITTDQFAIIGNEAPTKDINANMTVEIMAAPEDCRVGVKMGWTFSHKDNLVLTLVVICEFEIAPDDWAAVTDDEKTVIPKAMLEIFLAQTVGVVRGVLHSKTEGTPFNYIIIPPVNTTEIIAEDLIIAK